MSVDGILNITKPRGKTSFEIVSLVRKQSGERSVGHAGTLDPEATGVLLVCLGQGTRLTEFLTSARKTYLAEIELGIATDTYDASGKIIYRGNPSFVTRERLEEALGSFSGAIEQCPPMYSAVKYKGKRLYELARAGIEVERRKRKVYISRLTLVDWQPPCFTVEVECSAGTYVRSLAHDLGQTLGCGAHLKNLVRVRCGLFSLEDSVALPLLEDAFRYGYWQSFLYPIDEVLLQEKAAIVAEKSEQAIRKGQSLSLDDSLEGGRCRAYSIHGHFFAVLSFESDKGLWHPDKVFLNP